MWRTLLSGFLALSLAAPNVNAWTAYASRAPAPHAPLALCLTQALADPATQQVNSLQAQARVEAIQLAMEFVKRAGSLDTDKATFTQADAAQFLGLCKAAFTVGFHVKVEMGGSATGVVLMGISNEESGDVEFSAQEGSARRICKLMSLLWVQPTVSILVPETWTPPIQKPVKEVKERKRNREKKTRAPLPRKEKGVKPAEPPKPKYREPREGTLGRILYTPDINIFALAGRIGMRPDKLAKIFYKGALPNIHALGLICARFLDSNSAHAMWLNAMDYIQDQFDDKQKYVLARPPYRPWHFDQVTMTNVRVWARGFVASLGVQSDVEEVGNSLVLIWHRETPWISTKSDPALFLHALNLGLLDVPVKVVLELAKKFAEDRHASQSSVQIGLPNGSNNTPTRHLQLTDVLDNLEYHLLLKTPPVERPAFAMDGRHPYSLTTLRNGPEALLLTIGGLDWLTQIYGLNFDDLLVVPEVPYDLDTLREKFKDQRMYGDKVLRGEAPERSTNIEMSAYPGIEALRVVVRETQRAEPHQKKLKAAKSAARQWADYNSKKLTIKNTNTGDSIRCYPFENYALELFDVPRNVEFSMLGDYYLGYGGVLELVYENPKKGADRIIVFGLGAYRLDLLDKRRQAQKTSGPLQVRATRLGEFNSQADADAAILEMVYRARAAQVLEHFREMATNTHAKRLPNWQKGLAAEINGLNNEAPSNCATTTPTGEINFLPNGMPTVKFIRLNGGSNVSTPTRIQFLFNEGRLGILVQCGPNISLFDGSSYAEAEPGKPYRPVKVFIQGEKFVNEHSAAEHWRTYCQTSEPVVQVEPLGVVSRVRRSS